MAILTLQVAAFVLIGIIDYCHGAGQLLVVNGENASPGQFKHAVSLQRNGNNHFCGGSIVAPNWIVTAAHCITGFVRNPSQMRVMVGSVTLSPAGTYYDVIKVIPHERFSTIGGVTNDVGLIKLKTNINLGGNVASIKLADNTPGQGTTARVSGWGLLRNNGAVSNHLQYLDVQIISKLSCALLNAPVLNLNNQVCTTAPARSGVCNGDSGSALVYNNEQIGVVSWGKGGCASGRSDVYAEVSKFKGWITNAMSRN